MAKQILEAYNPRYISFSLSVPDKLDYWTINGKRVNFRIARINNPDYSYTGISIIVWIFSLRIALRAKISPPD